MTAGPNILAVAEYDFVIKIAVFLVIGVIWVVSQVVGAMSKKPDQKLPPSRPRPPVGLPQGSIPQTTTPPPLRRRRETATQTMRQRPPQATPPQRVPQQRRVEPQRPAALQRPAAAPPLAVPAPAVPRARPATASAYDPAPRPADTLPRRQMLDALLKPRNLRKAFIVTELLGPPSRCGRRSPLPVRREKG